jgi:hypothetical protein
MLSPRRSRKNVCSPNKSLSCGIRGMVVGDRAGCNFWNLSALPSAYRRSIVMFCPSTYPSWTKLCAFGTLYATMRLC